jgi:hypothetical protein
MLLPMDDQFESAWLKFAWAVSNSNVLADNLNTFASQPNLQLPITIGEHYDAKSHCIIISVVEIGPVFPPVCGLLLGDVVHNFRSALDHVAWALYKRGTTPNLSPAREAKVYFPIYDDRVKFNRSLKRKLPGVTRADIAKVRACQPYHAPKRLRRQHVLWVVDELSRLDKHRTIQPVLPAPDRSNIGIGQQTDCIFRRMRLWTRRGVLQEGTELARLYVKKTGPNPYIDVKPQFAIDPTVYDPRLTVEQFLGTTMTAMAQVLRQFAKPPESARAILGAPLPAPVGEVTSTHLLAPDSLS